MGGAGRVLFGDYDEARCFANAVRNLYRERTVTARVSVEVVERRDDEPVPDWMRRGVARSQENKLSRTEGVPLLAGRWLRPCNSCGQAVAEVDKTIIYPGEDKKWFCKSCNTKRRTINEFYRDIKRNRGRHDPVSRSKLRRRYPDYVLTTLINQIKSYHTLLPQDFNQIADFSKPSNYIGFIYADGNRMGEVIKGMAKKYGDDVMAFKAYRAFSQIVDESTQQAAIQAVCKWVPFDKEKTRKNRRGVFIPAEFVMAGGDDLILIVPAHCALDVAADFITLFNQETKRRQEKDISLNPRFASNGLTTSAGVVIAHASYPASQLMDLATDLMKLAKRKAAELAKPKTTGSADSQDNPKEEGTLDFMVLHESGSEPMKLRRKREYTRNLNNLTVTLTERPYTATEMKKLLCRIRTLKIENVPRNKLKSLYPILFQDIVPAQFDAQRIRERLEKTGDLGDDSKLKELIGELTAFPFREQNDTHWTTPLTEIIELYDFVQPVESHQENSDG